MVRDQPGQGPGPDRAGTDAARGLAEVEHAKKDGRWQAAYDGARTSAVPDDLVAALAAEPAAAEFFEPSTGEVASRSLSHPRRQEARARARRIEKDVAMLAEGEKLHP